MATKRNKERRQALAATNVERLRKLLVQAVDALDAALYADDESPRLDAAEKLLDELELWLDEHPLSSLRGMTGLAALARSNSPAPLPRGAALRFDVQPYKDDPEDYQHAVLGWYP